MKNFTEDATEAKMVLIIIILFIICKNTILALNFYKFKKLSLKRIFSFRFIHIIVVTIFVNVTKTNEFVYLHLLWKKKLPSYSQIPFKMEIEFTFFHNSLGESGRRAPSLINSIEGRNMYKDHNKSLFV